MAESCRFAVFSAVGLARLIDEVPFGAKTMSDKCFSLVLCKVERSILNFTKQSLFGSAVAPLFLALSMACPLGAVNVRVTVENLAPEEGNFLTPVWLAFHDGSFDIFDEGSIATAGLESIAEDGATGTLGEEFEASGAGSVHATVTSGGEIPPFAPGASNSITFSLDGTSPQNRYLSYASMIIPSNDAFVANGDPMAGQIFDEEGNFTGAEIIVMGSQVWDAGTELNDEVPANTAFLAQAMPDTGSGEGDTVELHAGFIPAGNILNAYPGADFTAEGFEVLRITVTEAPPNPISRIGVGTTHWIAPPLPPNRTCGSPASGSPVSTLLLSGDSSLFPGLF